MQIKRLNMTLLKRIVLVGSSLSLMATAVVVHAAPARVRPCGQPTPVVAFLQKVHLMNAKISPCATTPLDDGVVCNDPGHHCTDESGRAGKCTSVFDQTEGQWSCACVRN